MFDGVSAATMHDAMRKNEKIDVIYLMLLRIFHSRERLAFTSAHTLPKYSVDVHRTKDTE